jgi:hypothetical protein
VTSGERAELARVLDGEAERTEFGYDARTRARRVGDCLCRTNSQVTPLRPWQSATGVVCRGRSWTP